jgi:hypothetical protein
MYMHGALIPYLASFWMAGSRDGGLKIGPLVVPCPTNSTESSVIYKLTSGLVNYINLSQINNVCYIYLEITSFKSIQ